MIEINLLPDEFKTRHIDASKFPFLKILLVIIAIFAGTTFYLYFDFLQLDNRLKKLNMDWELLQPEFKILTQLKSDLDGNVRIEKEFMQKFVTTETPLTKVLMWLSELLPATAWLSEVQLDRSGISESLMTRGMVTSSETKSGIEEIESYLHTLKTKLNDAKLTLTTTREKVTQTDATQFVANFQWGASKTRP